MEIGGKFSDVKVLLIQLILENILLYYVPFIYSLKFLYLVLKRYLKSFQFKPITPAETPSVII